MREEQKIKDLAFAADALTHITSYVAMGLRDRLLEQIEKLLTALEHPTPITPTPVPSNIDDEIPF